MANPKRFRPIVQPVVQEESKGQRDRRLDWESRIAEERSDGKGRSEISVIAIVAIAAVAVLGGGVIFFSMNSKAPAKVPTVLAGEGVMPDGEETGSMGSFSRYYEYNDLKEKVDETVRGYLSATSTGELKRFVADRERVGPLIDDYYGIHGLKPVTVQNVRLSLKYETPDKQPEFYLVRVSVNGGNPIPLGVEARQDGVFVDWESNVGHNSLPLEELGKGPDKAQVFRLVFRKALFFDDRALFERIAGESGLAIELEIPGRKDKAFAFIGDSQESAARLRELVNSGKDHPAMIRLYGHPLLPESYVLVDSFLQLGWVDRRRIFLQDKDEEAEVTTVKPGES